MYQFIIMVLKNQMISMLKIQITEKGTQFDVYINGEYYDQFLSPQFGDHNILNTLSVIAISYLEKWILKILKKR